MLMYKRGFEWNVMSAHLLILAIEHNSTPGPLNSMVQRLIHRVLHAKLSRGDVGSCAQLHSLRVSSDLIGDGGWVVGGRC
jgi:hypothetical protein